MCKTQREGGKNSATYSKRGKWAKQGRGTVRGRGMAGEGDGRGGRG